MSSTSVPMLNWHLMHLIRVTIDDDDDDDDAGVEVNFSLQTNTSNKLIMPCDILNSNAIHFI